MDEKENKENWNLNSDFFFFFFQITWMDDRGLVVSEGVRTVQELMEDGKRYVTISILKFVADIEHHGRNFTCQAQNSANRHPASVSTRYGFTQVQPP